MKDQLIRKFADQTAVIGIVGLGYVGLPLMLRYTDAGFRVLGFDIDTFKTGRLNAGEKLYRTHPFRKNRSGTSKKVLSH